MGDDCDNPEMELCSQHRCVLCEGIVHVLCAARYTDMEDYICKKCDTSTTVELHMTMEGEVDTEEKVEGKEDKIDQSDTEEKVEGKSPIVHSEEK